jgi:hypothetical protein
LDPSDGTCRETRRLALWNGTFPHLDGFERIGFHHLSVLVAILERVDSEFETFVIDVDQQFDSQVIFDIGITKLDHLPELPCRIHVQKGEGWFGRIEGFESQVSHHRRVLADRVEHHWFFELGGHLADDMDALSLELF